MKEEWKNIKGYEGLYMISSYGRVKSLGRCIDRKCKGKMWKEEKIMKPSVNKKGYLLIGLCKNGVKKMCQVHRLVYEAFYGEIPKGMQVNHINEIKTDNRLENLNLMTPKENTNWGTAIQRRIEKQINGKKSKSVLQIDKNTNKIIAEFPSTNEVQRKLGFKQTDISRCCRGKRKTCGGFKWEFKNG